jgi:hypothetical protein
MIDDTILPFSFPAVDTKKVTAAFDGGRLTSNGGVMLLAMAQLALRWNLLSEDGKLYNVDNGLVPPGVLPYHGPYVAKERIIG